MKTIVESIKSNIVNEGRSDWTGIDAMNLFYLWANPDDTEAAENYGIDPKDLVWLRKHAYMMKSLGGYDGNGKSCADCLIDGGVSEDWICKVLRIDDIRDADDSDYADNFYNVFNMNLESDTCDALKVYVKSYDNKPMRVAPKSGIAWWNSGYDAPMIALFDVPINNPIVKAIQKDVEPFS